jgi:hypothetical protein
VNFYWLIYYNAKYLTEDVSKFLKIQIKLAEFDRAFLLNLAMHYSKVHTHKLIAIFLGK